MSVENVVSDKYDELIQKLVNLKKVYDFELAERFLNQNKFDLLEEKKSFYINNVKYNIYPKGIFSLSVLDGAMYKTKNVTLNLPMCMLDKHIHPHVSTSKNCFLTIRDNKKYHKVRRIYIKDNLVVLLSQYNMLVFISSTENNSSILTSNLNIKTLVPRDVNSLKVIQSTSISKRFISSEGNSFEYLSSMENIVTLKSKKKSLNFNLDFYFLLDGYNVNVIKSYMNVFFKYFVRETMKDIQNIKSKKSEEDESYPNLEEFLNTLFRKLNTELINFVKYIRNNVHFDHDTLRIYFPYVKESKYDELIDSITYIKSIYNNQHEVISNFSCVCFDNTNNRTYTINLGNSGIYIKFKSSFFSFSDSYSIIHSSDKNICLGQDLGDIDLAIDSVNTSSIENILLCTECVIDSIEHNILKSNDLTKLGDSFNAENCFSLFLQAWGIHNLNEENKKIKNNQYSIDHPYKNLMWKPFTAIYNLVNRKQDIKFKKSGIFALKLSEDYLFSL